MGLGSSAGFFVLFDLDFDLLAEEVDLALALPLGVDFDVEVLDPVLGARFELVFETLDLDLVAVDAFGSFAVVFFCEDLEVVFLAGVFLIADFVFF